MKTYSFLQFLLQNVCLLTILQDITGDTSNCNTPKLGPTDPLHVTIFDSQSKFTIKMWENLCNAVKQFPAGLIIVDFRAGALATGSVDKIQCGGGSCKEDQINECTLLHSPNYNDCFSVTTSDFPKIMRCYCGQEANKNLLENAALRASWKIPENAVPALAINQTYDSCFKFGSQEEILNYFCQVYQKKVGKCG